MIAGDQRRRMEQNTRAWEASQDRMKATAAANQAHNDAYWSRWDSLSRTYQANSNYIRDQTVITDSEGRHATLDNPAANSLLRALPGEFQVVPPQNFYRNQDF